MLVVILVGVLEKSRKATVCVFNRLELHLSCSFMINKGFREVLTLLLELNLFNAAVMSAEHVVLRITSPLVWVSSFFFKYGNRSVATKAFLWLCLTLL